MKNSILKIKQKKNIKIKNLIICEAEMKGEKGEKNEVPQQSMMISTSWWIDWLIDLIQILITIIYLGECAINVTKLHTHIQPDKTLQYILKVYIEYLKTALPKNKTNSNRIANGFQLSNKMRKNDIKINTNVLIVE